MVRTMSPGRVAVPLGMFSQAGTTPTRLTGSSSSAAACSTPSTVAAPHMSYFISSMAAPRLDRDAAGIEGDALADQHDRLRAFALRAPVLRAR